MKSENEWVLERIHLYHLRRKHPEWSLRQYARELGHDPNWVRKWLKRIEASIPVTLETFKSQSRAPKTIHRRISQEAKQLVGELRKELSERFHRKAGAKTIAWGLSEYAKKRVIPFALPKGLTTITQILHQLGWIQPRRTITHEPVILPPPMEEWEVDFGEIWLAEEGVFEFFVVIDRGTSRLVYVEGSRGYTAETALEAVTRLFMKHGLPKRLRFDRDVRLWGAWTRDSYPSPFVRFLRVLGIQDVICPPHRPDLKPFVERGIQTLKYEWLARKMPTTFAEAQERLEDFPAYYNDQRPHQGNACQNQPPSVAFPNLPLLPHLPLEVQADAWLASLDKRIYRRRVSSDGSIQIDRHAYSVGTRYTKQQVLVHVDSQNKMFHITCEGQLIKTLPIQGLYERRLRFWDYFRYIQAEARTIEQHHRLLWQRAGDGV